MAESWVLGAPVQLVTMAIGPSRRLSRGRDGEVLPCDAPRGLGERLWASPKIICLIRPIRLTGSVSMCLRSTLPVVRED